ncbi:MAG: hypothetical protein ACQEQF_06510 [Bacillota bacterium]
MKYFNYNVSLIIFIMVFLSVILLILSGDSNSTIPADAIKI